MAAAAGILAAAAVSLLRLTVPDTPKLAGRGAAHVVRDVTGGLAEFVRMAPPGGVAILAFAQTLLRGALVVLIAVLAVHVLALGGSAVGWLTAAFGAGGLAGGAVAAAAVRFTRLGRSFIAGMLLWGVPLAFLALTPAAAIAYLVWSSSASAMRSSTSPPSRMVTRLAGPRTQGKVLGALEFVPWPGSPPDRSSRPCCCTCSASAAPSSLLGGGLAGLALAHAVRFRRLDRAMPAPGPEAGLISNLPMFAPLPLAVTDLLAAEIEPRQFPAGAVVVREGEPGDHFYLIVDGSAAVSVQGAPRPSLHRGDCFGEIALLRDIPRTATVTARTATAHPHPGPGGVPHRCHRQQHQHGGGRRARGTAASRRRARPQRWTCPHMTSPGTRQTNGPRPAVRGASLRPARRPSRVCRNACLRHAGRQPGPASRRGADPRANDPSGHDDADDQAARSSPASSRRQPPPGVPE